MRMGIGDAGGCLNSCTVIVSICASKLSSGKLQLSSPSKIPGMPTRSNGIPSSASASIFNGCSRASREAKPGVVYCPLARPVLGISRSLGGFGGGGKLLVYRMRAM